MWPYLLEHRWLPVVGLVVTQVGAVVAQAVDPTAAWSPLLNIGAIGCVLAWFLLRAEPRMGKIERAIDRSSKTVLLAVIAMEDAPEPVKNEARKLITEIDDASNDRRK